MLDESECFSMGSAFNTGGAIEECIAECQANWGCPNQATSCDLKDDLGFAGIVERCLDGTDYQACVQVDDYARFTAGCTNICDETPPEPASCPCWDGQAPFPPSLDAYWGNGADCSSLDVCTNNPTRSFATCNPAELGSEVRGDLRWRLLSATQHRKSGAFATGVRFVLGRASRLHT